MSIQSAERAAILRQAALNARRHPNDLFGARMAIHDAMDGLGICTSEACKLLLSIRPPLTEWDTYRLEMLATHLEAELDSKDCCLLSYCRCIRMMTPD